MSRRIRAASAVLLALPAAVALSFGAFWRRKPRESDGGWTGPFSLLELREFLQVIGTYFALRDIPAWFGEGEIVVEYPERRVRYPLQALADDCYGHDREEWPALVAAYFSSDDASSGPGWPDVHSGSPPPRAPQAAPSQPPPRPAAPPEPACPATRPPQPPRPAARPPLAGAPPADNWESFSAMLQEWFRGQGYTATVERDQVLARGADGRERRFQAPGLARAAERVPRAQWARLIDGCFGHLLQRPATSEGLAGHSFDELCGLLAIQLYDEGDLSAVEREATIYSQDLPGLLSAVVCRLPEGSPRVPPDLVSEWGVAAEDVFVTALGNLRGLRPPTRRVELAPGVEGIQFGPEGDFAAAQALLLGDDPEYELPYGALIALPRRGLLLVYPLRPMANATTACMSAVTGLVESILQCEREGQTPLSRSLYWYRDGTFVDLPYTLEVKDGTPGLAFYPPDEFVLALDDLEEGALP